MKTNAVEQPHPADRPRPILQSCVARKNTVRCKVSCRPERRAAAAALTLAAAMRLEMLPE